MIAANELRIGNWVRIRDYILIVKAISNTLYLGNNNTSDFIHDDFNYSDINPIPLTPEILEKCGFRKKETATFDYYVKYFTQTDTKGCEQKSKFSLGRDGTEVFINDIWLCGIDFLHQLQNLYFDLTGEELPVLL